MTADKEKAIFWAARLFMSVRVRVAVGFVLLIAILGIVVGISVWLVGSYRSSLAEMDARANIASQLEQTKVDAVYAGASIEHYILTGDPTRLDEIRKRSAAAMEHLTRAAALADASDRQEKDHIAQLVSDAVASSAAINEVILVRDAAGPDAASQTMQAALPSLNEFWAHMEDTTQFEHQQAALLRDRADRVGRLALWFLIVSGVAGAGFGIAGSYLIARSILQPLSRLGGVAKAVAAGDLSARAPAGGPTELAELAQTLNYTIATLEQREKELMASNEELKERNRQLLEARSLAASDALTGLGNHRSFHEAIRREVYAVDLHGGHVSVIMMDIDGFKAVNDTMGHLEGDKILRECAAVFTQVVKREHVYRYGGDEFAVILPGMREAEAAEVAERLRRAIASRAESGLKHVSISLGVASYPENAGSAEELIYRADAAMYSAKAAGKDRVSRWEQVGAVAHGAPAAGPPGR